MKAQGCHITDNILNQDKQSTVSLARNGKASSVKITKHINIIYFFVTDRISNKEMSVEYYPADDMLGDFFTKPTKGSPSFKIFQLILNLWTDDIYIYMVPKYHRSVMDIQILRTNNRQKMV